MTLNDVMAVMWRYLNDFGSFMGALRKCSRSLSHLLMTYCCFAPRDRTIVQIR